MSEYYVSSEGRQSGVLVAEHTANSAPNVSVDEPLEAGKHESVVSPAGQKQGRESEGGGASAETTEGMEAVAGYQPHFLSYASGVGAQESTEAENHDADGPVDAHLGSADEDTEEFGAIVAALAPILIKEGGKALDKVLKRPSVSRRIGPAGHVLRKIPRAVKSLRESVDEGGSKDSSLLEVVIGEDDRVRIRKTKDAPWSGICQLNITARNGRTFVGTGWLIDDRTVVTAGHCVFMHKAGGWVESIDVTAGRDGDEKPFGTIRSTRFFAVKGWTKDKSRDHDYAAIVLPNAFASAGGVRPSPFQFAALTDDQLKKAVANVSGYPADSPSTGKNSTTAWFHARRITSVTPTTILYSADTGGGDSGAGVWVSDAKSGRRVVCGIHTNGFSLGNSATRINDVIVQNLNRWREQK
jgi:V8-like Glu-specific endopeptidase